jgi:hypothetical protein
MAAWTVWVRMVKAPGHTRVAREGLVGVYYPTFEDATREKSYGGTTRWGMESPAMKLSGHGSFEITAGFADDFQYTFLKKIRL